MINRRWLSFLGLRRKASRRLRRQGRRCAAEVLEPRNLLTSVPWGAAPNDTGEFMLGTVTVTVVLLESNGQVDTSTENWTPQLIAEAKSKIRTGVEWWEQTLSNLNTVHSVDFQFDFTYADQPVPTRYEPISRESDDYVLWVNEFLDFVGFNSSSPIDDDIYAFNHSRRVARGTNWAFTIFVVNSTNDLDGQFRNGGSFVHAFAFPGGRYIVTPSTRPDSTIAHEAGHMFWGRDEYPGGGSYLDRRGYYNSQNLNAWNNPAPGFVQQDSIMAAGTPLINAYNNFTSAVATLAQVGWQDSNNNGVFDVLDVPHQLRGAGYFDVVQNTYRFLGNAQVGTLPNKNTSGPQNDLTINRITRAEYRINGGAWTTAATYGTYTAALDLKIAVPTGHHQIEIRTVTIDPGTQQLVTSSPIFVGWTDQPVESATQGIHGFVWNDTDADGEWDPREIGISGRTVRVVNQAGQPLALQRKVEPDDYDDLDVLNSAVAGVTVRSSGLLAFDETVLSREMNIASTGGRVFANFSSVSNGSVTWSGTSRALEAVFDTPQTYVAIDAIGAAPGSYGRLEAYDAQGNLLTRDNSDKLEQGQSETLIVMRGQADIKSVKAFGRSGTSVLLDHLRFGPPNQTITGPGGSYWLENLPAGTYFVETVVPLNVQVTKPADGRYQETISNGDQRSGRNLGLRFPFPWQNPMDPLDVNADGLVNPFDMALIISDVIRNSSRDLAPPTDAKGPPAFFDTTGDNKISPFDAARILSRLAAGGSGSGEPGGRAPGSGNPPGGGGGPGPEGESGSAAAENPTLLVGQLAGESSRPSPQETRQPRQPSRRSTTASTDWWFQQLGQLDQWTPLPSSLLDGGLSSRHAARRPVSSAESVRPPDRDVRDREPPRRPMIDDRQTRRAEQAWRLAEEGPADTGGSDELVAGAPGSTPKVLVGEAPQDAEDAQNGANSDGSRGGDE